MYDFLKAWADENEPEKARIWFADREKLLAILRLYMGIGMKRRRKDFVFARQVFELTGYFFDIDDVKQEKDEFRLDAGETKEILTDYLESYKHEDDNSAWFDNLKNGKSQHT